MRYVYLANGELGAKVLRWLVDRGTPPVGLVVHPPEAARSRSEIETISELPPGGRIDAARLRTSDGVDWLRGLRPDWLVSVLFGGILRDAVIGTARLGAVNLHPAFLPYNRGAYPNVWSIVERTPAGVTLHHIAPGAPVDSGDIIAQRPVEVLPTDTGATLHRRLEEAAFELFRDSWPLIEKGDPPRRPQPPGGTTHRRSDVERIDRIDPDAVVRAGDLIDVLRARTFTPYSGAYLDLGGRRIQIKVELAEEVEESQD